MYKVFVFAPRDQKIIRSIIDAASKAGAGKIENIKEVKIEMQCPDESIKQVVEAVKKAHPYEEVVIDVFKMESFD